MRKAKYRIDQVTIEGFRGFTKPQTINLGGKNVFIFGPNGHGKSSIIEAIRWCLFGSPSGSEISLRNEYYSRGDCCAVLVLRGDEGQLEIRRELRPGHTQSDLKIRDESGKSPSLGEALPKLKKIGHQEGTQVIFAAQQAVGRGTQVDIADFTRVLCYYLHLEDVRALLDRLRELVEERSKEAKELAAAIELAENSYRERIASVRASMKELLGNPPWSDGPAPTGAETGKRVVQFVTQLAKALEITPPDESDGGRLLLQARKWLTELEGPRADALRTRAEEIRSNLVRIEDLLGRINDETDSLKSSQDHCVQLKADLRSLLDGRSVEVLRNRLEEIEATLLEKDTRAELARIAAKLCQTGPVTECPTCAASVEPDAFRAAVSQQASHSKASEEELKAADELRGILGKTEELQAKTDAQESDVDQHRDILEGLSKEAGALLDLEAVGSTRDELQKSVGELESTLSELQYSIKVLDADREERNRRIKDLEEELRYHKYRDDLETLEWQLGTGMEDSRGKLRDYRELLGATGEVRSMVQDGFRAAMQKAIPHLNDAMTSVYQRLTQQASFDLVRIHQDPEEPEKLELRVASSHLPGDQSHPLNILNGQAAKAIQLVPYFVFSRFQPEVMELDLLLIDDPSESFDTSHVDKLVQELAVAAEHAQLVVATHESEKFEPCLEAHFGDIAVGILHVKNFNPREGPELVPSS